MPTIVRDAPKRQRKKTVATETSATHRNAELKIGGPCDGSRADPNGVVTMRDFWQLRQELSGAKNRIDELEAQVLILARGGKEKEFYSVEEAAQIWGVSKSNLYLMIRQGRIPAIKIGEVVRIARGTLITGPTN